MRAGQKPHMRRMTYTCRVLAIALVFVVLETTLHHALKSRDESFLEIAKCPACFGVSMCPSFYNGEIALGTWSQFSAAMNVNSKNVYNANYKDKEVRKVMISYHSSCYSFMSLQVVLKKLGHDFKLSKLDKYIQLHSHSAAEHTLLSEHEDVATAIRTLTLRYVMSSYEPDRIGKNGKSVHHLKIFESAANISRVMEPDFNGSELLTCPSQRKIDIFEDRVFAKSQGLYRLTFLYNFMTMLLLNSEPLVFQVFVSCFLFPCPTVHNSLNILQTFPAEEGWPFPVYLGACGRLVVEENVGPTLDQWLPSAHWVDRVHSALQLLSIAKQFTLGVSGLRLYLTDLSLYNVAVDPQKSLRIIDGGNIVIVDLKQIEKGIARASQIKLNLIWKCNSCRFRIVQNVQLTTTCLTQATMQVVPTSPWIPTASATASKTYARGSSTTTIFSPSADSFSARSMILAF